MSVSISVTIFITGPVFTWYGDRYQKFCTLLINSEAVGQTGGSGCLLIAQLELPPNRSWRRCDLVKCQRRQKASLPHVHPVPLTNVSAPLSHLPPHTPTHPRMSSPLMRHVVARSLRRATGHVEEPRQTVFHKHHHPCARRVTTIIIKAARSV